MTSFHSGTDVALLFDGWHISGTSEFAGIWLLTFALTVATHLLKHYTAQCDHAAVKAALAFLGFNLTYGLMLIVMSYNTALFFAVTSGLFVGWLILELTKPVEDDNPLLGPLSPGVQKSCDEARDVDTTPANPPPSRCDGAAPAPVGTYCPPKASFADGSVSVRGSDESRSGGAGSPAPPAALRSVVSTPSSTRERRRLSDLPPEVL